MTHEEKEILQRLKDDFKHYASKVLKVRSKSGAIEPLILNKAQLYVHQKLEEQRGRTGKVRALILKARQQGMCLSPDTRILTSDYRWLALKDIQVGQELIGCDEYGVGVTAIGRQCTRKLRSSIVEAKVSLKAIVFHVVFDNGAELKLTGNHRMLCQQRGGDYTDWREAKDFKIGDSIRVITRPPNYTSEYIDGWVGGVFDGEGSWRGKKGPKRLTVHQTNNEVLEQLKSYFNDIDMPYVELIDNRAAGVSSKLGNKAVHRLDFGRLPYIFEILSRCRPTRFVNRDWFSGHELPGKKANTGIRPWAKVVSIQQVGEHEVIDLQTSTKTFIAEGLVSHNSTYIGARYYHRVTHSFGCQAFILAHSLEATNNLYQMAKRFYEHTPEIALIKHLIAKSNAKELVFAGLDSGYKLGTAENRKVGRSATIQLLHWSETAFSSNTVDHTTGILQAVPNSVGTEVILESTANGVGNFFHQQWQDAEAGLSEYIPIFIPWYWQDEYKQPIIGILVPTIEEEELQQHYGLTLEQLNWRRNKIVQLSVNGQDGIKAFCQEYPSCATEAFILTGEDNYIPSDVILSARKAQGVEKIGSMVLGVDPARFGDDRTCIIRRCGRLAYKLESHIKLDTMQVAGLVKTIIENERPAKVCIDVGGLGAGVVDRLRELGFADIIVAVNFGATPYDASKYRNRKSEMWGLLKEWLLDGPVMIPDSDELHADLSGVKYAVDSNSRLVIESKESMKRRGVRSCDTADSLCLTFSVPNSALNASIRAKEAETLHQLRSSSQKTKQLLERSRYR